MAESTCLHIQESESGPIRVVALPWLWARVGRASYCEIRLHGEHLPDEVCRLQRKGRTWYVMATSTDQQVVLGGRQVRGSSLLPFDVPIEAAGHRLTLRPDISCEPVWELGGGALPSAGEQPRLGLDACAITADPSVAAIEAAEPRRPDATAVSQSAAAPTNDSATRPPVQSVPPSASAEHRRGGLADALRRAELAGLPGDRVTSVARPAETRAPSAGLGHRAAGWEAKWRAASAEIRNRPRPEPVVPAVERKVPTAFIPPRPSVTNDLSRTAGPGRAADHVVKRPAVTSLTPPISRVAPTSSLRSVQPRGIPKNPARLEKTASPSRTPLRAEPPLGDPRGGAEDRTLVASTFDAVNELIASQTAAQPVGFPAHVVQSEAPTSQEVQRGDADAACESPPVEKTGEIPVREQTPVPDRADSVKPALVEEISVDALSPHTKADPDPVAEAGSSERLTASLKPAPDPVVASAEAAHESVASHESVAPDESVAAQESVASHESVATRESVASDESVASHEPVAPDESVASDEPVAAHESVASDEPVASESQVEATHEHAEYTPTVGEQAASKRVVNERRGSAQPPVGPDRKAPGDRAEKRRALASDRSAAPMARAGAARSNAAGRATERAAVDWPSAANVLALHRVMAKPTEMVSRNRQGRIQALPTKSTEPDHWSLPAWLALPPVASAALLAGAAGLLLSCIWASDSYNASYVMHHLLYGSPGSRRQTLPSSMSPPPVSWARTTGQHLAYWGMYTRANGVTGDSSRAEAAAMLAGAAQVSPLDPLARLAVAQLESGGEHSMPSAHAVGLSRDSVSLAWSARSLAMTGKKPAALALYVRSLELASSEDPRAAGVPRFNEDPKVPRYFLPGEDRYREIIKSIMATDAWTIQEWTEALPPSPVVRLAAARMLREQGRSEADGLIDAILTETRLTAREEGANPLVLAARAEALAIKGGYKESGREYRQAIEAMPNDWIRRSWWFNLADIAYRMDDDTERQSALRYALAVATSDDITRRATDTQRAVGNRRALGGSSVPRAN